MSGFLNLITKLLIEEKEVNKMAEEKMMGGKCCAGAGKKYMLFGVLAIIYGIINYMTEIMGWQPYMAWIVGGVILLLIAWAKGAMRS
jgi:hypothetical protein